MQRYLQGQLLSDRLELLTTPAIDQRHHDFQLGMRLTQQLASLQEDRRQQCHLGLATPRQHRQITPRRIQPQPLAGRLTIAVQRHGIRHGVTDEATGRLMLIVKGLFKRQEGQYQIGRRLDLMNTGLAPGPDRGADIVHRLDALTLEDELHPDIEIRGIDADEEIRWIGDQFTDQLTPHREQARQARQHLDQPHHRQLFHLEQRLDPLLLHAWTGDADELDIWMT